MDLSDSVRLNAVYSTRSSEFEMDVLAEPEYAIGGVGGATARQPKLVLFVDETD